MAASALCIRPADCLGGRPFSRARTRRGVRAAPAPRRPMPQQKQEGPVATTAATYVPPGQPQQARGRANGRRRGRRSPRATGSPTQERAMENVVLLKRGETKQVAAALALPPPAAAKSGVQVEKAAEHDAAAEQSGARVQNAEPVAAAGRQRGPDTRAQKAEAAEQAGADATNAAEAKVVAAADQHVPRGKDKDDKNVPVAAAAAKRSGACGRGGRGMKAGAAPPALYSGSSFAAAPEPHELPIPLLLLDRRGARLRPRDDACAAPTAAPA